ncbi:hypothetical protein HanPI659440_Chr10g0363641 [Helianthus annuus]|nr:hypothetical protein HanPI659440_Chr10g0363641 [Helianthus annuus]
MRKHKLISGNIQSSNTVLMLYYCFLSRCGRILLMKLHRQQPFISAIQFLSSSQGNLLISPSFC